MWRTISCAEYSCLLFITIWNRLSHSLALVEINANYSIHICLINWKDGISEHNTDFYYYQEFRMWKHENMVPPGYTNLFRNRLICGVHRLAVIWLPFRKDVIRQDTWLFFTESAIVILDSRKSNSISINKTSISIYHSWNIPPWKFEKKLRSPGSFLVWLDAYLAKPTHNDFTTTLHEQWSWCTHEHELIHTGTSLHICAFQILHA